MGLTGENAMKYIHLNFKQHMKEEQNNQQYLWKCQKRQLVKHLAV